MYRIKYRYNPYSVKGVLCFPNKYNYVFVNELNHKHYKNNVISSGVYKTFSQKYARRVQRLKSIMSSDAKILFIHLSYTSLLVDTDNGEEEWNKLVELSEFIKQKYPSLDFEILAFNVIRENKKVP